MKYALYIDYRSTEKKGYEYLKMNAKNILEAIEEADKVYNPETMYLIRIMEKSGKIERVSSHETHQLYIALECKRSHAGGWHTKKTYDVAVYGEDVVENMTIAELDAYLSGWYVEDEKEYHVLPQYLDEFGYIDEDYVMTSSELTQLANDWGKNPADIMHMLDEI